MSSVTVLGQRSYESELDFEPEPEPVDEVAVLPPEVEDVDESLLLADESVDDDFLESLDEGFFA